MGFENCNTESAAARHFRCYEFHHKTMSFWESPFLAPVMGKSCQKPAEQRRSLRDRVDPLRE